MKKVIIILMIIVGINYNQVRAFDAWTKEDTAYQLTLTSLLLVDWAQTREMVKDGRIELNPILGDHPSMKKVNTLIPLSILGHYLVSRVLSSKYRRVWQCVWIGVELNAVSSNYMAGIRFEF
jgi:hypothetical protein